MIDNILNVAIVINALIVVFVGLYARDIIEMIREWREKQKQKKS